MGDVTEKCRRLGVFVYLHRKINCHSESNAADLYIVCR